MTGPIILVALGDPEHKPLLYACGSCGHIHSPMAYLASSDDRHAHAKAAALDCYVCRTHNNCKYCGVECSKSQLVCEPCRIEKTIADATEIETSGGPYFSFSSHRMYRDLSDAVEDGQEWLIPADSTYPKIDAASLFDDLFSDMFEDASVDDLKGVKELEAAIEAFNVAQNTPTFWGDPNFKVRVPAKEARA